MTALEVESNIIQFRILEAEVALVSPTNSRRSFRYKPGFHSPTTAVMKNEEVIFPKTYPTEPKFQH